MILTLPGWLGRFDVDVDFDQGTPASYGPNGGDAGDSPSIDLELIVWEFSPHDALVWGGRDWPGAALLQALEEAVWAEINRDPEPWYRGEDLEFYDLQEAS